MPIGIGEMFGGGIFPVPGPTVQIAGAGEYLSFVVGGIVAALTGWSYSPLPVRIVGRGRTAVFLGRAFGTNVAGPLNLLLWLSYFVMLGLHAVAFGAYLTAPPGLDGNGPWPPVSASAVVVCLAGLNPAGAQVAGHASMVSKGISLMSSAGFLIIFAAVNLAAARLVGTSGRARARPLACTACPAGLTAHAAASRSSSPSSAA